MILHPLDVPRPKERYEVDLYDSTRPACEAVQRAPLWHFALAGAGIGALIVLYLAGVL